MAKAAMSKVKSLASIVFSLVVVILVGWGIFYLITQLINAVRTVKPDANLLTALVTGLLALVSILVKQWFDRRDTVRQDLRQKKVPIYEQYMQMWFDLLHITKAKSLSKETVQPSDSTEKVQETMIDVARQLILWGSTDVIKKHVALRRLGNPNSFQVAKYQQLLLLENALKAIRSDLGHSNYGLQPGDLITLFVNDDADDTKEEGV